MDKNFILPDQKAERMRSLDTERGAFHMDETLRHLGEGKTYFIRTYGCAANARDTETIVGILRDMGYTESPEYLAADLIVFNTCAIRKSSEDHVLGELGNLRYFKEEHPDKIFALCGCMAQEEGVVKRIIQKYPMVDVIFGTHNITSLPSLLAKVYSGEKKVVEVSSIQGAVIEDLPVERSLIYKGSVNIMYGCDKFCTYCIVPYTRGKQRSRLPENILKEVKDFMAQGGKEITLLGQNVNAYGKDLGFEDGFAKLLDEVADTGIERIRFDSAHPRDFTPITADVMARHDNIMNYFHLAVQSGSDEILRRMNRGYSIDSFKKLIDDVREKNPGILLTTDLIVGFPGETDEQFQETLDLVDYAKFYNAFAFVYSPREGTPAASMEDDIPLSVKKERLRILNEKLWEYGKMYNEQAVGTTMHVLCDGPSKKKADVLCGYSEDSRVVNFTGIDAKAGDFVDVEITAGKKTSLNGIAIVK